MFSLSLEIEMAEKQEYITCLKLATGFKDISFKIMWRNISRNVAFFVRRKARNLITEVLPFLLFSGLPNTS